MGADSAWACSAAPLQPDGARIRQDRPRGARTSSPLIWIKARGKHSNIKVCGRTTCGTRGCKHSVAARGGGGGPAGRVCSQRRAGLRFRRAPGLVARSIKPEDRGGSRVRSRACRRRSDFRLRSRELRHGRPGRRPMRRLPQLLRSMPELLGRLHRSRIDGPRRAVPFERPVDAMRNNGHVGRVPIARRATAAPNLSHRPLMAGVCERAQLRRGRRSSASAFASQARNAL